MAQYKTAQKHSSAKSQTQTKYSTGAMENHNNSVMRNNFLRRSVALSFVLGTMALTWYASEGYHMWYGSGSESMRMHHHQSNSSETTNTSDISSSSNISSSNNRSIETAGGITISNETSSNSNGTEGIPHNNSTAEDQHHHESASPLPISQTSWWDVTCSTVYALGSSWWILTCFLAYLAPLFLEDNHTKRSWIVRCWTCLCSSRKTKQPNGHYFHNLRRKLRFFGKKLLPTRIFHLPTRNVILWCLVVAPSMWVFLYGTYMTIPFAKRRVMGSESDDGGADLSAWLSILVAATAMPAGTAGMVSMGIYVFGTVAMHSPLWSSYVVLPEASSASSPPPPINNTGSSNNSTDSDTDNSNCGHANLMKDALRLHQWAGYVTAIWFSLHTLLYCLIYGFEGVFAHFSEASAVAATNITNVTTLLLNETTTTDNTTTALSAADDSSGATDSTTGQLVGIFFAAVWNAMIPPPECRPILKVWEQQNQSSSEHRGNRELFRVLGEDENNDDHASTGGASFGSETKSNQTQFDSSHAANTTITSANSKPPQQQQQQQQHGLMQRSPCYGYYRNFNGFLAITACLVLILTSLNFVRRWNYRFFYISHVITATIFVLTMVFHMKRIVVYLLPSLVVYVATTIPTLVQDWIGAIFDGGVRIEKSVVLVSSSSSNSNRNNTETNVKTFAGGVAEITFLVESPSAEEEPEPKTTVTTDIISKGEASFEERRSITKRISHRPKSVRICVPSISLLWYPFTVIEPSNSTAADVPHSDDDNGKVPNNNLRECKILFGTVGYFTKTLWKRLHELQEFEHDDSSDDSRHGTKNFGDNYDDQIHEDGFDDEDRSNEVQANSLVAPDRSRRQALRQPLILVDGFYSGASDWIESAMTHDFVLVAAGGTGVTPFLTFLPRLLQQLEEHKSNNHQCPSNGNTETGVNSEMEANHQDPERCGVGYSSNSTTTANTTVSFLWCCRDEALIKHVINTYLIPLFETTPKQQQQQPGHGEFSSTNDEILFRIMIYNTSRDSSDSTPLEVSSSHQRITMPTSQGKRRSVPRGVPMRPARLQYHPSSSRAKVLARAITLLSIALMGLKVHLWSHDVVHADRFSFSIRAYGLYAIFIWSFIVGILSEVAWRSWSICVGSSYSRKGYAIAGHDDDESAATPPQGLHVASGEEKEENGSTETEASARNSFEESSYEGFGLTSLAPGTIYSDERLEGKTLTTHPLLQLSISNGRPVLKQGEMNPGDEIDNIDPSPSEVTLQQIVQADRPGIFYCGPDGLLETMKTCVNTGRNERRRLCGFDIDKGSDRPTIPDCTFYEESFEM